VDQLIAGYRRFRAGHWQDHSANYKRLSERQNPDICVLSCCDSRVDPVSIFNADPGDMFVIRNVANLVPPYRAGDGLQGTSTAIEFAVRNLKVGLILVLGHARCGGVRAAIDATIVEDAVFLKQWINLLNDAKQRLDPHVADDPDHLEHESIRVSLDRLMSFPFVADAVKSGQLKLAGARFSIFDGKLEILDQETGKFAAIEVDDPT
jgi:carbonic anhydrase